MKKHLLAVFFFIGSWFYGSAQWVSIPDSNFVSFLQTNYPSAMNGNLLDTTDSWLIGQPILNCAGKNIHDLTGLQYFNWIDHLFCGSNQLTTLPPLPASLNYIHCSNNQLTSISVLPDSLSYFNCSDNTNLFCLPVLKKIKDFNFYNTGIACLLNYPQSNSSSFPYLNNIPLCDPFGSSPCTGSINIKGRVYQDTSINCLNDAGEPKLNNIPLNLYQNGILKQQRSSFGLGHYSFETDTFTYQYSIDSSSIPFIVSCPDSGYYTSVITSTDSFDSDGNFGLRCKPGFDLVAQSMSGLFVPGQTRQVYIRAGDAANFYSARCISGVSGTVQLVMGGPTVYISPASGAVMPTSVSGDTVTWSIADFHVVNFFSDFNIMVRTDSNAQAHSPVCFSLVITPLSGDNNISNNALDYCGEVRTSHDPNEKEVYPAGNIDTTQKWLTYTIHFQNTGTAEAQHIYVTDTLDSNVDAASFQLLAYSHQPMVQIKENAVRFNFPNINLPDSNTNEPLSHGYVQYKVKLKDNLPLGTTVNNTAFIYFDFNSPVVTNTTTNTITTATGISKSATGTPQFAIFPNPATNSVAISIDENMLGSTLTVYDITGRKMSAVQLSVINNQLSIARFAPGIYLLEINKNGEKAVKRLVKE